MISKPKYKIARRLGAGVYEKTQTPKFAASEARRGKKKSKPKALSGFGEQLLEKQKIRYSYGVTERQLSRYVKEAVASKEANTPSLLFDRLERRLDNAIYRMGIASTRALGRQMVSHGHILVNGRRVTIPSYEVKKGDVVAIREGSKSSPLFQQLSEKLKTYQAPKWVAFNPGTLTGKVEGSPVYTQEFFNIDTVLEFYSR